MKHITFPAIIFLVLCIVAGASPASGAAKKPVKHKAPAAPGFIYRPVVHPNYVTNIDSLPVVTFSADEDVSVEVEPRDASGLHRLAGERLADTSLKKGVKIAVAWKIATLPNGYFNFHITMTNKAGQRSESNVPFTFYLIHNPNRSLILF